MTTVAQRGLARAAQRLAGAAPERVCASLQLWRERQHRELPWLAGQGFSALSALPNARPTGPDVRVLERFLVGGETDAATVTLAIDATLHSTAGTEPAFPPDARGRLVEAVEDFFDVLADAYGALHAAVRDGHRRYVDELVADWQLRLDAASAVIDERTKILLGIREPAPPKPKKVRGAKDRPGVAVGFVLLALITAGVLLYLVLHGWPMEPFDFAI